MQVYSFISTDIEVPRGSLLVDTNVLVAAFLPADDRHTDAHTFIMDADYQLIIPVAVIVETWGFLCGSRKRIDCALSCISWVSNPGNAQVFLESIDLFNRGRQLTSRMRIDLVDALLAALATDISKRGGKGPPMRIATYDRRDFLKCKSDPALRFSLFDPDTMQDEY